MTPHKKCIKKNIQSFFKKQSEFCDYYFFDLGTEEKL